MADASPFGCAPLSITHFFPVLLSMSKNSEGREWGVGSDVVDFRVFGAPRFSVQRSQNTYFKGFWGLWTEDRGAPKTQKSTTTDPTPHSRPSEKCKKCSSNMFDEHSCFIDFSSFSSLSSSPLFFFSLCFLES